MTDPHTNPTGPATRRWRVHAPPTRLAVIATVMVGGLAASPAQAVLGPARAAAGAPRKLVTVLHPTFAFSTPYFDARDRHAVKPNVYVAICEARSSQAGPFGNHWWSQMNEGTWVNNGFLSGSAEKQGIPDCAAPRDDGNRRGITFTHGIVTSTVYFNKSWTKDMVAVGEGGEAFCTLVDAIPVVGPPLGVACTLEAVAVAVQAVRADNRGMCLKLKFVHPPVGIVVPDIYRGRYCT
jgi:hypothetical protein